MESKTGKIVAAVIMTVLMLVFLLPPAMQGMAGQAARGDIGSVAGEGISRDDLTAAEIAFGTATGITVNGLPLPVLVLAEPEMRQLSQLAAMLGPEQSGQLAQLQNQILSRANDRVEELSDDGLRLYLLLREAQAIGGVSRDDAATLLAGGNAQVRLPDDRVVPFSALAGDEARERYITAAQAALDIASASRRYASAVKVSRPVAAREVAAGRQRVTLDVVPVAFDDFVAQVDEPGDADVQKQFDSYRDVAAGAVSSENPFGFGYQRPDRVKVDYLSFDGNAARETAVDGLLEQGVAERGLELYRAFTANRAQFAASTRPASRPATRPTTQPAGGLEALLAEENDEVAAFLDEQAATLEGDDLATWQAFSNAHDDVVRAMVAQRTNDLLGRSLQRATSILSADFASRRAALDAGDVPNPSRVGVAADADGYLQAVAAAVGDEAGLRPETYSTGGDFVPVAGLADPGVAGPIATARAGNGTFAQLVGALTLPLLDEAATEQAEQSGNAIELYRPGPPLPDAAGNVYIFRVTAAEPAAAPEQLDAELRDQVANDLRRQAAYDLALAKARELAAGSGLAGADGATVVGPFLPAQGPTNLPETGPLSTLDAVARASLGRGALNLIASRSEGEASASGVIEIPTAGLALAAALREVQPLYTSSAELERLIAGAREDVGTRLTPSEAMLDDYFSSDSVLRRTGFEPAE